jgi:hypothetical protein
MRRICSSMIRRVSAIYRWLQRQRDPSYAAAPTWKLAVLASAASVESVLGWAVVIAVGPVYLRAAQSPGAFGSLRSAATRLGLGLALLIIAGFAWGFTHIGRRCGSLLRERLLP